MKTLPQKLLEVQKSIGLLIKDSKNPFFKSKYADLNQVLDLAKEHLHPHGLVVTQGAGANEYGKYIETSIIDAESGTQISTRIPFSGKEEDMQKIGAAITYGRRFGLVSLLALGQEDHDGEDAVGRGPTAHTKPASVPAAAVTPKALAPVQAPIPAGFNRKACEEEVSLTSKVLVGKGILTQEAAVNMLHAYAVKDKKELNEEQLKKLLGQYKELLK